MFQGGRASNLVTEAETPGVKLQPTDCAMRDCCAVSGGISTREEGREGG